MPKMIELTIRDTTPAHQRAVVNADHITAVVAKPSATQANVHTDEPGSNTVYYVDQTVDEVLALINA